METELSGRVLGKPEPGLNTGHVGFPLECQLLTSVRGHNTSLTRKSSIDIDPLVMP